MKKRVITISVCVAAALLVTLLAAGFLVPYLLAGTAMGEDGKMLLVRQENGELLLSWTQSPDVEQHYVEVLRGETVLFEKHIESGLECPLPSLPLTEELTVRVSTADTYKFLFSKTTRLRKGKAPLEVTTVAEPPKVEGIVRTVDANKRTMQLQFDQQPDTVSRLYLCSEQQELLKEATQGSMTVSFGKNGDFEVLSYGEALSFSLSCSRTVEELELCGFASERVTVCGEDFLGTDPNLEVTDEGNNRYTLSWYETKGERQLLQRWNEETEAWDTLREYAHSDTLTYDTGYLSKFKTFKYRIVGVGGQTLPDSEFSTLPAEVEVTTGATALFATVWPIQNLEVYSDAEGGTVIGSVSEGKAFCVTDIQNGKFRIRYEGDKLGYVDSNYCMVNLPEYMGDRCVYNISNSFKSRYMIHNYGIPEITDKVTAGYGSIRQGQGNYLVPLLYPTAQKLDRAAAVALEQGYKLKIYDSYRPRKATLWLYDIAESILGEPLPPTDYNGADGENAEVGDDPEAIPVTYGMLMTDNDRYKLNYFLAKGGSRHNMGVALDLTLVRLSTGEEVQMQTNMHDLSWYSETAQNNYAANELAGIMYSAGFGGLSSEWWHFQDNDAVKDLKLTNYMHEGVSAECWMADETGWRYRRANGKYETDCEKTIGDITYRFDGQGYATALENQT